MARSLSVSNKSKASLISCFCSSPSSRRLPLAPRPLLKSGVFNERLISAGYEYSGLKRKIFTVILKPVVDDQIFHAPVALENDAQNAIGENKLSAKTTFLCKTAF